MLHKTRPNEKFPLHLKKAGKKVGLARRNIVHGKKKPFFVVSVSAHALIFLTIRVNASMTTVNAAFKPWAHISHNFVRVFRCL